MLLVFISLTLSTTMCDCIVAYKHIHQSVGGKLIKGNYSGVYKWVLCAVQFLLCVLLQPDTV